MTERTENKINNFDNAVKRLNEANVKYKKNKADDIYRDVIIKRFEFTFELAWKCLKEYMLYSGFSVPNTPRGIIKLAYQENLIDHEDVWLAMMEDRNNTAHVYDESVAEQIAANISVKYCKELTGLKTLFEEIKR